VRIQYTPLLVNECEMQVAIGMLESACPRQGARYVCTSITLTNSTRLHYAACSISSAVLPVCLLQCLVMVPINKSLCHAALPTAASCSVIAHTIACCMCPVLPILSTVRCVILVITVLFLSVLLYVQNNDICRRPTYTWTWHDSWT
jgi:hypothetical protein